MLNVWNIPNKVVSLWRLTTNNKYNSFIMNKVYLYSRVSTDQQSLAQQERTVYEWLKHHEMEVTDVVSDEGVSGGVSYKDRRLGKELLPKMNAGDMLIVSEISRLGRSMFDLSKLIHEDLKPRKIRLVVVGMGLDLRCDNLTAMDELILNNFSFAAQLEKQLISERTLSALQVKRKQGVKLGAASDKYKASMAAKGEDAIADMQKRKGCAKTKRHLESKDSQAFLKAIHRVFPDHTTDEDPRKWEWAGIRLRCGYLEKTIEVMRDFHDMNPEIFSKWDFSSDKIGVRLRAHLCNFKKSILNTNNN